MDNILTVKEVAEILKVKPITVREMFRENRLRGFKIGKSWRTTQSMLEQDLATMANGGSPADLPQPNTPKATAPPQRAAAPKNEQVSSTSPPPTAAEPKVEPGEAAPPAPPKAEPPAMEAPKPKPADPQPPAPPKPDAEKKKPAKAKEKKDEAEDNQGLLF